MSDATERDKALYQQIKDARGLYRGLAIVYLLILVACVIMAIACVITRKLHGILPLVGFASGAWFSASLAHIRCKDYASALEEIGPDPAGLDTCETYSETTAYAIETARMTKKELLQQWIAYSILTLTLLGMGALLLTFCAIWDLEKEYLLLGVGVGMVAGGLVLASLTAKAFHGWLVLRRIEKYEASM